MYILDSFGTLLLTIIVSVVVPRFPEQQKSEKTRGL